MFQIWLFLLEFSKTLFREQKAQEFVRSPWCRGPLAFSRLLQGEKLGIKGAIKF